MANLGDITGIGATTEERLRSVGVDDVDGLAQATVDDLDEGGISASKAEKIISRARERTVIVQTGDDVAQEYEEKEYRTTGIDLLDEMLGGGFKEGDVVGITGASDSGKTQLCFQSMVQAVEETGNPAVYIETEKDNYQPERIAALANEDDTQSKIFRIKAYGEDALEKQLNSYSRVSKLPSEMDDIDGISLVAVDSFNARFRMADRFDSRGTLKERSTEFGAHLRSLEDMIDVLNCPVLLTLQVYGNPSGYGSATQFYGGELVNHMKSYMIKMSDAQGSLKKLELGGHPGQPNDEIHLNIQNSRIDGMRE